MNIFACAGFLACVLLDRLLAWKAISNPVPSAWSVLIFGLTIKKGVLSYLRQLPPHLVHSIVMLLARACQARNSRRPISTLASCRRFRRGAASRVAGLLILIELVAI